MNRKAVLSLCCALLLGLTACSNGDGAAGRRDPANNQDSLSENERAYGSYKKPVKLDIGFKIITDASKLASGDTNTDNPMYRYLEDSLNINIEHVFETKDTNGAFGQKVNLAIASNEIPDAIVVNQNQLRELVENDMLADLTDVYPKYASPLVKDILNSNPMALDYATFDGKLMAIPNISINANAPFLLWVRKDWLDKLNLPVPKTLDDIEKTARAFIDQDPDGNGKDDTLGLSGDKSIVFGGGAGLHGFDTVFSAYHAFPKNWVKDKDGNVVYGSITPEAKTALAKVAEWYKKGLIEKDFALHKDGGEVVASNKVGMYFGAWWTPWYPQPDSIKNDPKAEWIAAAAPLDSKGQFTTHMEAVASQFLVVRKGYAYPEAPVKLLNMFTRFERGMDPNTKQTQLLKEYATKQQINIHDFFPFNMILDYGDAVERKYAILNEVVSGKLKKEDMKDDEMRQNFDFVLKEQAEPKTDFAAFSVSNAYLQGGKVLSQPYNKVYSLFYGQTDSMKFKWTTLDKLENETYLQIVMGKKDISAFDSFVTQWKKLGGDEITKEVQEIVNVQK